MTRTIEITVAKDGQTTVETRGFAGSSCRHASEFIEKALGQKVDEQLKPEFYSTAARNEQAARQGN